MQIIYRYILYNKKQIYIHVTFYTQHVLVLLLPDHCLQVNSSKTEILAHAGPVAHALETSYRVEDFVKGIDELRDLYFHSQIVSKHFQREAEKDGRRFSCSWRSLYQC